MSRVRAARVIVLLLTCAAPGTAAACSVCFSTTEENRFAFIATTLFLSAAPLALLFGIASWLKRRVIESERQHEAARKPAGGPSVSPDAEARRA